MKKSHSFLALAGSVLLAAHPAAHAELSFLSGISIPGGGEVVSVYDNISGADSVLVTHSTASADHKVEIYSLGANGMLGSSPTATVDLNGLFGAGSTLSVSSVAADPLGRGFGVATIIPNANNTTPGKLAFFDVQTGSVLRSIHLGYHPDAVRFTPDGSKILVANEGEYVTSGTQAPGSLSIVNMAGIGSAGDLGSIVPGVTDVDFQSGLASGVNIDNVRYNVTGLAPTDRHLYIEPEYVVATNNKAYVTLQENNAVAIVDLDGANANKVTAVNSLGTITQVIDASDRDGAGNTPSIGINDTVVGLPMPDTITTFEKNGVRYLATANEGDARIDDGDIARAGSAGLVDATDSGGGDLYYAGSLSNTGIGRLNISKVDGNLDADAGIEVPTMIGTRSFSIWDEQGNLVFDSGSMIEQYIRDNFPNTFNMNSTGSTASFDTRSDDKGPEIEAIAFGSINDFDFLFVGAERQGGIFQFDITDLNAVSIVGYYNVIDGITTTTSTAYVSPETITFVPASESPNFQPLLIVGYEGSDAVPGSVAVLQVATPVPEPAEVSLAIAAALGGLVFLRRFRRARQA
jgi:hypothetical protein